MRFKDSRSAGALGWMSFAYDGYRGKAFHLVKYVMSLGQAGNCNQGMRLWSW